VTPDRYGLVRSPPKASVSAQGRDRVVLSAVVFAVLFAQVLLYPGIPELVSALGATPTDWAGGVDEVLDAGMWFLTAEFLGFVLFAGLWGATSDAVGRRTPLVVAGALVGAAGYLVLPALSALSLPYWTVLVVRFVQGAATIGAFSLAITTLMDLSGGNGRNMGAAGLAIGGGTGLGAPVGGQLYGVGPLVPLYAATVVLAGAGVLALSATDRTPTDAGSFGRALGRLRSRPTLAVPFAFGFVDRLTAGFFALVGTVYFQSELGLDPAGTGLLLGAFFVPFALLQYPLGRLSDVVGRVLPVAAGSLAYGLAVVGVFYAPTVAAAALAMVTVGVLGALVAPATMALVTDLAAADQRGVAMGGFNVVGSLGFLAGIVGGATVAARVSFEAAFLAVGLSEVVIAVAALPLLVRLDVPTAPWLDPE
jgi:MFS family permease